MRAAARHAQLSRRLRHAKCFLAHAAVVLVCGCLIMRISFGIRAGFGLFLQPMSLEYGWGREVFSFSIALQNLMWGALGAFAGGFADRYGPGRVIAGGAICYILGLIGMAFIDTPLADAPQLPACCSAARSAARRSASSSPSSAAPWRPRGAAWRWASPPRPARSASSRCCRSRST